VCDEDATLELKVKTVRYFKGIQETMENLLRKPMEGYAGSVRAASGGLGMHSSPMHAPVVLPHGVPGSTKAMLNDAGEFVLRSQASEGDVAGMATAAGAGAAPSATK
jgi:hypothetical protein